MSRAGLDKGKRPMLYSLIGSLNNMAITRILIAVFTYVAVFSIVLTIVSPNRYDLEPGDIPEQPIRATRDIEDEIATLERIDEARSAVSPVYLLEQGVKEEVLHKTGEIFEEIQTIRGIALEKLEQWRNQQDPTVVDEPQQNGEVLERTLIEQAMNRDFLNYLRTYLSIQLSNEEMLTIIGIDQAELAELQIQLSEAVSKTLDLRIKQENLLEAQSTLREEIMMLPLSNEVRLLGVTIGLSLIRPNMVYDEEATEHDRLRAAEQVERVVYRQGQYIAQAGQPITERQIAMLRNLGLLDQVNIPLIAGIGLIVLMVHIMVILYLFYFEKEIIEQPVVMLMISLIVCLVLGLGYISSTIHPYLMSVAVGGMLITVLLHSKVAIVINIALGLLLGFMMGGQINIILIAIVTGMMGIFMVNKLQNRNSLIWVGVGLGVINMLLIWGSELIATGNWLAALQTSGWGMASGMLSAVLTVGTLPIWENLFGVITPIRLVELSNPSNIVLKRMLVEAPGTYHHSIIVANLAESAADAIGANGLLARVGAYYHDIGKLKRPYYFKENMTSSENPHDNINPSLSTNIITSHTKEGLELAKRYGVPKVLHDFIAQHHGTSPVTFFYHKAKTINAKDVKLEAFRHKGPKPKTPEVAIVMMADTVEAAVRALPDPTPGKVEGLIRKLVKEKLEDGQFDECHLTLKDIESIANAFSNVICGTFHERIEYPEVDLKEEEKEQNDAGY